MSKYVIKNCKSLISNDICELYSQKGIHLSSYCYCKDKNCLLKKIVEKCREAQEIMDKEQYYEDDFDTFNGESIMAERIFDLLDIEEYE